MAFPNRTRCNATGKIMYETRDVARDEGLRLAKRAGMRNVSPKPYRCESCDSYHVTTTGKGKRGRRR